MQPTCMLQGSVAESYDVTIDSQGCFQVSNVRCSPSGDFPEPGEILPMEY